MKTIREKIINRSKTIVIKIGSQILTNKDMSLNKEIIAHLVKQIAFLIAKKKKIILVSSGAVAAGMGKLKVKKRPCSLPDIQALASIGQSILIEAYRNEFNKHHLEIGQLLLTKEDFQARTRYLNIKNTLSALSKKDIIPIINENDTVITDEITFGDNDHLTTLISHATHADLTIILSNIEGFLDINNDSKVIPYIEKVDKKIMDKVSMTKTRTGVGGMSSKIQAIKKLSSSGEAVMLAKGNRKNILTDIIAGMEVGTLFIPQPLRLKNKKKWIAFSAKVTGEVSIDKGAKDALLNNSSLLAIGIKKVTGNFIKGSMIKILHSGKEVARGLSNYSKVELEKIKGLKSKDFFSVIGTNRYEAVIHKDNLVITIDN